MMELSIGISSRLMQWGLSRIASGPEGSATGCTVLCFSLSPYLPPCKTCHTNLPTNFIIAHVSYNVHAGENVRLQNAGHKQTDSYLSLKVSLQNRRLHEKQKAVSGVCRMKQCKAVGLH